MPRLPKVVGVDHRAEFLHAPPALGLRGGVGGRALPGVEGHRGQHAPRAKPVEVLCRGDIVLLPADHRPRLAAPLQSPVDPATLGSALDALEALYPALRGTIRDQATKQRRPFMRYFACGEDLSLEPLDLPLPAAVLTGAEPLRVVGAMAGG